MSDAAAKAASIASEALSNVVVVQAFGANKRLEANFADSLEESKKQGIRKALAVGIQTGVLYFIAYSANALAFWYGSRQIAASIGQESPSITVGQIFTVIFVLIEASALLSQVAPWISLFSAATAAYEKLRLDMERKPLIDSTSEAPGLRLSTTEGGFEIQDLTFKYPSRPEIVVLDKLSLSIPALKHTAIVGLSGSGKSTIAGLLTRLYDPIEGRILIDGHDLRELNIRSLRSFTGLVQQEPALLDRSILENIANGLAASSRHEHLQTTLLSGLLAELAHSLRKGEDLSSSARSLGAEVEEIVDLVLRAAKIGHAHDFISAMQHGYGTTVGSTGRLISGGQRQRIALAMAVVKDPKILILDEATAALDSSSEISVQRAITEASTGRTTVTIAHRLSTIASADNIIVMHKGQILEQGTHAALMASNGVYAGMVRTQSVNSSQATKLRSSDLLGTKTDAILSQKKDSSEISVIDEKAAITTQKITNEEEMSEPEPETPKKSLWALMKGYGPALRPHAILILIAFTASVIVGGSYSGEAVIFGNTIASLSPCETSDQIRSSGNFFGLMFFVLGVIELFANIISWTGFGLISERLVCTVRVITSYSIHYTKLYDRRTKSTAT